MSNGMGRPEIAGKARNRPFRIPKGGKNLFGLPARGKDRVKKRDLFTFYSARLSAIPGGGMMEEGKILVRRSTAGAY